MIWMKQPGTFSIFPLLQSLILHFSVDDDSCRAPASLPQQPPVTSTHLRRPFNRHWPSTWFSKSYLPGAQKHWFAASFPASHWFSKSGHFLISPTWQMQGNTSCILMLSADVIFENLKEKYWLWRDLSDHMSFIGSICLSFLLFPNGQLSHILSIVIIWLLSSSIYLELKSFTASSTTEEKGYNLFGS